MLKTSPVGLDISDRTIEIVALSDEGGEVKIVGMNRVLLPRGVVERGRIKNAQKLAEALATTVKNARPNPIEPKRITFGIPEGQMYTRVFELAEHKREDRDMLVEEEMKSSIPLPKDEALYTYATLYETPRRTGVILIAVSKHVFAEWQALFRQAGFSVDAYESETIAAARGLFRDRLQSPVCIVDIGAAATTISIFSKGGLRYLQTLAEAGDAMTLALSKELNISPREAEQVKIKQGLSDTTGKSFFVIAKILQVITTRVKAGIEYFQEKTGERVDRVILIGGSAKLKDIKEYYEENVGMSVWLGESVVLRNQGFLEYIVAGGLALRGLYPQKYIMDPAFLGDAGETNDTAVEAGAASSSVHAEDQEGVSPSIVIAPVQFVRIPATRGQKIVLLGVLVAGIGGVFGAGQVRDMVEARLHAETSSTIVLRESGVQVFNDTIPIIVSTDEANTPESVTGVVFETEIDQASGYLDAVARGRAEAATGARQRGMALWQEAITIPVDVTKITFPLRISWLLYRYDDIVDRMLAHMEQKTGADFRVLSPLVTILNITPTADSKTFTVSGRIRIKTPTLITVKNAGAEQSVGNTEAHVLSRVVILKTDTGWLNARNGPDITHAIVTRVHPGEKYVLLEEDGEWYKIDMGGEGGAKVWVHSEYAKKE
ncbi:MAG: pilus assembly protein PilM [Patescibacteria group bacterium]